MEDAWAGTCPGIAQDCFLLAVDLAQVKGWGARWLGKGREKWYRLL